MNSPASKERLRRVESLAFHTAMGLGLMRQVLERLIPTGEAELAGTMQLLDDHVRRANAAMEDLMIFDESDEDIAGSRPRLRLVGSGNMQPH